MIQVTCINLFQLDQALMAPRVEYIIMDEYII